MGKSLRQYEKANPANVSHWLLVRPHDQKKDEIDYPKNIEPASVFLRNAFFHGVKLFKCEISKLKDVISEERLTAR